MSVLHRKHAGPADPAIAAPAQDHAEPSVTSPSDRVSPTWTGAAWLGVCVVALASVALTVFLMQNTGGVEVTFLWMHGSMPLALALLVASVGAAILTMVVGAARIGQLHRHARRSR
jgi:uncharacterized integral membrane protein